MKRIYIDKHSTGFEKRIYQKALIAGSIMAAYQGTWCELFRTKGYKKARSIEAKIGTQISHILYKEFGKVIYSIDLIGSIRKHHVAAGINQAYLLTIHDQN